MTGDIHIFVLSTEPFLWDEWLLRYLDLKLGGLFFDSPCMLPWYYFLIIGIDYFILFLQMRLYYLKVLMRNIFMKLHDKLKQKKVQQSSDSI